MNPRHLIDHLWTRPRLSAYLDGELDPSQRARVERHTGRCPRCQALLASLRRIRDGLAALPLRPAAPGRADAVMARLGRT